MTTGRQKPHHTHEINDAYAEGWDARLAWKPGTPQPVNPYTLVTQMQLRKQTDLRREAQERDRIDWDFGWEECTLDITRRDLPDVTAADFRRVRQFEPVPRETSDDDDCDFVD